ncbi:hypothetical protein GGTG_10185 [Gaeumannomyces tritici R3-111a-1]|uniref:Uncharacterized protein n=1 Tax=Gaeumannomyces tritici (strain R3-111a-1) TaxID=644352 RepID=J3P9K5_GAET3|nr:hypothetical protein GGTG_10185 [Gaeumannomyces tritici R3-111a-1]EJT73341.1 hypothetical protein GGTG_10185 [Gaeumannomyces tritici R3-111a-1]
MVKAEKDIKRVIPRQQRRGWNLIYRAQSKLLQSSKPGIRQIYKPATYFWEHAAECDDREAPNAASPARADGSRRDRLSS